MNGIARKVSLVTRGEFYDVPHTQTNVLETRGALQPILAVKPA
jgi:hypothetical protein